MNKKNCLEGLELLREILNKHKIFFWLSEGTALGFRRSGDFIDHDDDVDISIFGRDQEKLNGIMEELRQNGFAFSGKVFGSPYMFCRKGEMFDIDVVVEGGYCAANLGNCDKIIPHLKAFRPIIINGNDYYLPLDSYYRELYGDDWHIPIKGKKPSGE